MAILLHSILDDMKTLQEQHASICSHLPTDDLSAVPPDVKSGMLAAHCRELFINFKNSLDELALHERRCWNARRSINRLPVEVLGRILGLAPSTRPGEAILYGNVFWRTRGIRSTCHWWRECAFQDRSLWSLMRIRSNTKSDSLVFLWEKSQPRRLNVDINLGEQWPRDQTHNLDEITTLSAHYASHCANLVLMDRDCSLVPLQGDFKYLKNLSLYYSADFRLLSPIPLFQSSDPSCLPQLWRLEVSLSRDTHGASSSPLPDPSVANLDFGSLRYVAASNASLLARHCLQFSPFLQNFKWQGCESWSLPRSPTIILSPILHSLCINAMCLKYLAQNNSLSSVTILKLTAGVAEVAVATLCNLLETGKLRNLQVLHLANDDIICLYIEHATGSDIDKLLSYLPNLRALRLYPWNSSIYATIVKHAISVLGEARPANSSASKLDIFIDIADNGRRWASEGSLGPVHAGLLSFQELIRTSELTTLNIFVNTERSFLESSGKIDCPFIRFYREQLEDRMVEGLGDSYWEPLCVAPDVWTEAWWDCVPLEQ